MNILQKKELKIQLANAIKNNITRLPTIDTKTNIIKASQDDPEIRSLLLDLLVLYKRIPAWAPIFFESLKTEKSGYKKVNEEKDNYSSSSFFSTKTTLTENKKEIFLYVPYKKLNTISDEIKVDLIIHNFFDFMKQEYYNDFLHLLASKLPNLEEIVIISPKTFEKYFFIDLKTRLLTLEFLIKICAIAPVRIKNTLIRLEQDVFDYYLNLLKIKDYEKEKSFEKLSYFWVKRKGEDSKILSKATLSDFIRIAISERHCRTNEEIISFIINSSNRKKLAKFELNESVEKGIKKGFSSLIDKLNLEILPTQYSKINKEKLTLLLEDLQRTI